MAQVIRGLTGAEMRHSVVCLKGEPEIADRLPAQTEIHCMHARPNEPQLPLRLARLMRRTQPTLVHARNWGAWPDTIAARLLWRSRTPVILSFHGLGRAGYMPWRRRMASRILGRMASGLFTVSESSKRLMVARWGWPDWKVNVIPNGVDTDRFCPGPATGTGHPWVVGTVGNLRAVKNQALLIRACHRLAGAGRDLEIRIAGEGDQRAGLLELARSLGISDRLRLVGRIDDVPAFLRALDVFVLPSDSEQHPNALNEAMACGLPCVATRVGCVEELLDEGRCGIIVDPDDCRQLADALDAMIGDRGLRERYAAAARQQVCRRYSLRAMLSAYGELYRRRRWPRGKD